MQTHTYTDTHTHTQCRQQQKLRIHHVALSKKRCQLKCMLNSSKKEAKRERKKRGERVVEEGKSLLKFINLLADKATNEMAKTETERDCRLQLSRFSKQVCQAGERERGRERWRQ